MIYRTTAVKVLIFNGPPYAKIFQKVFESMVRFDSPGYRLKRLRCCATSMFTAVTSVILARLCCRNFQWVLPSPFPSLPFPPLTPSFALPLEVGSPYTSPPLFSLPFPFPPLPLPLPSLPLKTNARFKSSQRHSRCSSDCCVTFIK